MEAVKDIIKGLKMRISDLKAKEAQLKQHEGPLSTSLFSLLDTQSRLEELAAMLAAVEILVKQEPSGPKVVGNIKLDGNIEQQFMEAQIQEWEEDYFEGY